MRGHDTRCNFGWGAWPTRADQGRRAQPEECKRDYALPSAGLSAPSSSSSGGAVELRQTQPHAARVTTNPQAAPSQEEVSNGSKRIPGKAENSTEGDGRVAEEARRAVEFQNSVQ